MKNYLYLDDYADPKHKMFDKVKSISESFKSNKVNVIIHKAIEWQYQLKNIEYLFSSSLTPLPKRVGDGKDCQHCYKQLDYLKVKAGLSEISQLQQTTKEIKSSKVENYFHGMILDLRLDEDNGIEYKGSTIAQEIRQRAANKSIIDFPLILCTGGDFYDEFYKKDNTIHDTFDKVYIKGKISEQDPAELLFSLAHGYDLIYKRGLDVEKVLCVSKEEKRELIDYRFIEIWEDYRSKDKSVHDHVNLIFGGLLNQSGILVNESVLEAKLGISMNDNSNKKEDWDKVKKSIKKYYYKGVFGDYQDRWWERGISFWWKEKIDSKNYTIYNATERVNLLNKVLNVKLKPYSSENRTHQFYSSVCYVDKVPIDIQNALQLKQNKLTYPWVSPSYISINEKVLRTFQETDIEKVDREKFNFYRRKYMNQKTKPQRKKI